MPSVSGGVPHKYTLHKNSPPLPEGLELDEASGVVHGRPIGFVIGGDVVVAIKIVASNSGGESSLSITIQITAPHEPAEAAEGSKGQGGGDVGVAGAAGDEAEEDEEDVEEESGSGVQELPPESRLLLKEGSLTKRATTGKNSWKVRAAGKRSFDRADNVDNADNADDTANITTPICRCATSRFGPATSLT